MTNFYITMIDEHDCTVAGSFQMTAVDLADAELQLLDEFGPVACAYLDISEETFVDDI